MTNVLLLKGLDGTASVRDLAQANMSWSSFNKAKIPASSGGLLEAVHLICVCACLVHDVRLDIHIVHVTPNFTSALGAS